MRRWTPADDEQLLSLRQARKSYAEMAGALDRTLTAVSKRVQDLGLAKCQFDRDARRHKLVNSYQVRGVQAEVRWARARLRLGEHGWPPDLNPKEISILESLRTRGPQSRRNLSLSIGEPLTRPAKKRLMTHGGCSAVARLLARSLVTRCFLNSGRKRVIIYALTRLAEEARGTFPSVESFSLPISARRGDSSTPYRLEKAS